MTRAISYFGGVFLLVAAALPVFATGPGPVPGFNAAATPLVKVNATTVGIRASSSAQSGYMSATQASDLAFVLAGGLPTPTPAVLDPLTFANNGQIKSTRVPLTYMSDTFTRPDVADITGTPIQNGGVNWQNTAFGAPSTQMGVVSNSLQCTDIHCSGFAKSPTAEYVDTSRSDVTLSVDTQLVVGGGGTTVFFARINAGLTQALQVYNSAFSNASHICIEGYGAGAPAPVCSSGFALSSATVTVTLAMSGNTVTAAVPGAGATVTLTTSYNNTATRMGVQYGANGQAQTYRNFIVSAPLLPNGLEVQGYYANGTDFATLVLGEDGNATDNPGAFTGGASLSFTDDNAGFGLYSADGQKLTWGDGFLVNSGTVSGSQLISTVSIGTAPATAISTTKVANWNADLLDGLDSTAFQLAGVSVPKSCANSLGLAWGTVAAGLTVEFTGQTCTGAAAGDECMVSLDTTKTTGLILFGQGDGANTVVIEAGCLKATPCVVASQNTKIICSHH